MSDQDSGTAKPSKGKGKKAKRRSKGTEEPAAITPQYESPTQPLAHGAVGMTLFTVVLITVALVAIWFKLDVNRVFDVPKALALKVGGGGTFLIWLVYGLFGPGFSWRSFKLFAGPIFALTGVVVISTFLSLDVPTSVYGVYERQFGLQGFLACVGLYTVTASTLGGRRGAVFGFGWLAFLGGVVGTYALLQSQGWDPFPFFFEKPHNKVYSFLGNATFAGNALALIFPISTLLAVVASAQTLGAHDDEESQSSRWVAWGVGLFGLLLLLIFPGIMMATNKDGGSREAAYKFSLALSFGLAIGAAALGSWGPQGMRLAAPQSRRLADAVGAGVLCASAVGIVMGLLFTRTRGAWVGSIVAIGVGLVLLPLLFRGTERFAKIRNACWGSLFAVATLFTVYVTQAEHICPDKVGRCMLYANTIRSIPAAFDPDRVDFGKGQGTRRFLWTESPRVLVNHEDTLQRIYKDRALYDTHVETSVVPGITKRGWGPVSESETTFDSSWRKKVVWLFGIGVETYRFAFMSHKSKRLEALDPMTNHDNPHNNYLYILASFGVLGLLAYLWLLWRLLSQAFLRFYDKNAMGADSSIGERAIAFGVVTSVFSYSVYSIAGFDSVACSVFLFFMLGCAAAFFQPVDDEPPENLLMGLRRHWAQVRGRDPAAVVGKTPVWAVGLVAVVGIALLGHTVIGAVTVYRAERAFVGDRTKSRDPNPYYRKKLENVQAAIRLHPSESFYRQNLGSTYLDMMRLQRRQAQQALKKGDRSTGQALSKKLKKLSSQAKVALYSALAHAWAPENIYISLFQVYYQENDLEGAKQALRMALSHSPHLGAVRANLAALELQTKQPDEARKNAHWVLTVDPRSATAHRTLIQAWMALGRLQKAQEVLANAQRRLPKDKALPKIAQQLQAKLMAAASTTSAPKL